MGLAKSIDYVNKIVGATQRNWINPLNPVRPSSSPQMSLSDSEVQVVEPADNPRTNKSRASISGPNTASTVQLRKKLQDARRPSRPEDDGGNTDRQTRPKLDNFYIPGGITLTSSKGNPSRTQVDDDIVEVPPQPKKSKRASSAQRTSKSARREYNESQLKKDRARRQSQAENLTSTQAQPFERKPPMKRLRRSSDVLPQRSGGNSIELDPESSDEEEPVTKEKKAIPPPEVSVQPVASRRSTRLAVVERRKTTQALTTQKALLLEKREVLEEVRNLTTNELGYDGPRHLIFMYPPGGRGKIRVTAEERERLKQKKYLNDSLIDFYIKFLETEMNEKPSQIRLTAKFFSSFFFGILRREKKDVLGRNDGSSVDYNSVKNWTKEVDVFSTDFVIVPICDSYHWSLMIVANLKKLQSVFDDRKDLSVSEWINTDIKDPDLPKIIYMDSLDPKRGGEFANSMRHYLAEEWLTRIMNFSAAEVSKARSETCKRFRKAIPVLKPAVPVQQNEYDCGLFVLKNLSMFLDDTHGFRKKLLRGETSLYDVYGSGDIDKLRFMIILKMDAIEAAWKLKNQPKVEEGGEEKANVPLEEEEEEDGSEPLEIHEDVQRVEDVVPEPSQSKSIEEVLSTHVPPPKNLVSEIDPAIGVPGLGELPPDVPASPNSAEESQYVSDGNNGADCIEPVRNKRRAAKKQVVLIDIPVHIIGSQEDDEINGSVDNGNNENCVDIEEGQQDEDVQTQQVHDEPDDMEVEPPFVPVISIDSAGRDECSIERMDVDSEEKASADVAPNTGQSSTFIEGKSVKQLIGEEFGKRGVGYKVQPSRIPPYIDEIRDDKGSDGAPWNRRRNKRPLGQVRRRRSQTKGAPQGYGGAQSASRRRPRKQMDVYPRSRGPLADEVSEEEENGEDVSSGEEEERGPHTVVIELDND